MFVQRIKPFLGLRNTPPIRRAPMIRTKWPVKCTAGLDGVRAEDANRYTQEVIDSPGSGDDVALRSE